MLTKFLSFEGMLQNSSELLQNFFSVAKKQKDKKLLKTNVKGTDFREEPPLIKDTQASSPLRSLPEVHEKLPLHSSKFASSSPYFPTNKSVGRFSQVPSNKRITEMTDDKKYLNLKGLKRFYSEGTIELGAQPGHSGRRTVKKFCSEREENKDPSLTRTKSFPLDISGIDDGFDLSEVDFEAWDFEKEENSISEAKNNAAG